MHKNETMVFASKFILAGILSKVFANKQYSKSCLLIFSIVMLMSSMLTNAYASYVPPGLIDNGAFTTFSLPTAWDPGANTARVGGFPAGGGATWSIMGAGLSTYNDTYIVNDPHSDTTVDMTSFGFTQTDIENMINSAMNIWASVSGFTNLGMVVEDHVDFGAPETGNILGDIRIGAIAFDGSSGVLAHGYQPGNESIFGAGGSIAGDIHIDSAESWKDCSTEACVANVDFDLATVILHELGHALGLGHTADANAVMNPYYQGVNLTLGADDILGIQSIYGTPTYVATVVPLPASGLLLISGLGVLGIFKRRYN